MVKELRERTGAGMMECKKALTETSGDIDAAAEALRKKGAAAADKKSSRIAAEGIIIIKQSSDSKTASVLEINCETDFVAKDASFAEFASQLGSLVLARSPSSLEELSTLMLENGNSVEHSRTQLIGKIGENVSIRRFQVLKAGDDETVSGYLHGNRIGVLIKATGEPDVGRDVAMHVAASKPLSLSVDDLDSEVVEKEREIFRAQAEGSGKPAEIIDKMVNGRMQKFLKENTLLGQPFVKDPDLTVEKYLAGNNASVSSMIRFEVGEGLEKRQDDFAAEVMAQAKGA
jgi:elongation factor Ts